MNNGKQVGEAKLQSRQWILQIVTTIPEAVSSEGLPYFMEDYSSSPYFSVHEEQATSKVGKSATKTMAAQSNIVTACRSPIGSENQVDGQLNSNTEMSRSTVIRKSRDF